MNLTIQQPTTLIKIRKISDKELTKIDGDCNIGKEIDFYDLDFNKGKRFKKRGALDLFNLDLRLFDKLNNDNDAKILCKIPTSASESNDFKFEQSLLKMSIDVSNRPKLTEPTEFKADKPKGGIDLDFIVDSLRYDLRVKEFEITKDNVLVYFFCKDDSLAFYKQYFRYIDLSFGQSCDWLSTPEPSNHNIVKENNTKFDFVDIKHVKPFETTVETTKDEFSRSRFEEKIEYFNQLKNCFTKAELKAMSTNIDNRNTDFVFTNTKELAVGSKSNKIMQEAIKIMSGTELDKIYENLEYDIVPICASKHGAYTIQTLLSYSTNTSHRKYISKYFAKEGEYLLAHDIGNYTFQKLLLFNKDLVRNFLISNFEDVVNSDLGLKVFRRCIEHLDDENGELRMKIEELKVDNMSLYVQLQQIFKHW